MTAAEKERIELFVEESFPDGTAARELRLSSAEADYVRARFPEAVLEEMSGGRCPDGKVWYDVKL